MPPSTRYLAIDPGSKRTGLALGDSESKHAGPLHTIHHANQQILLQEIKRAIRDYAPDALVIGIPYNIDDTIGPGAQQALLLADTLKQHFNLPVHPHDERLTSFEADLQMAQTGLTRQQKKSRRDALAAANILNDFLNTQTQPPTTQT